MNFFIQEYRHYTDELTGSVAILIENNDVHKLGLAKNEKFRLVRNLG